MNVRATWKTVATIFLVFVGGLTIVLTSFAWGGFPFPSMVSPALIWGEILLLLVLLGIPLFR